MNVNILHNSNYQPSLSPLVLMPSTEGLSDLAFEKGWRILDTLTSFTEVEQWKDKFNCEYMDSSSFFVNYLAEDVFTDPDEPDPASVPFYDETQLNTQEEFNTDDEGVIDFIFDELNPETEHEHPETE